MIDNEKQRQIPELPEFTAEDLDNPETRRLVADYARQLQSLVSNYKTPEEREKAEAARKEWQEKKFQEEKQQEQALLQEAQAELPDATSHYNETLQCDGRLHEFLSAFFRLKYIQCRVNGFPFRHTPLLSAYRKTGLDSVMGFTKPSQEQYWNMKEAAPSDSNDQNARFFEPERTVPLIDPLLTSGQKEKLANMLEAACNMEDLYTTDIEGWQKIAEPIIQLLKEADQNNGREVNPLDYTRDFEGTWQFNKYK